MYQNFIFDLYGTLVDTHTDESTDVFWSNCASWLRLEDISYTAKELCNAYCAEVAALEEKQKNLYLYPEIDLEPVFAKLLHTKTILPDRAMIQNFATAFRSFSRSYLRLYPQIPAILDLLKKHDKKIYLLSNAQALFTLPEMDQLQLTSYFDSVYISSVCHCKKPDPAFMNRLLTEKSLSISESLMVGNDFYSDVAVADAVGMDSLYVHTNLSPDLTGDEHATYLHTDSMQLTVSDFLPLI